jgi:hypothetical protein
LSRDNPDVPYLSLAPHPRDDTLFVVRDQDGNIHPTCWWGATRDEIAEALLARGFTLHEDDTVTGGWGQRPM